MKLLHGLGNFFPFCGDIAVTNGKIKSVLGRSRIRFVIVSNFYIRTFYYSMLGLLTLYWLGLFVLMVILILLFFSCYDWH